MKIKKRKITAKKKISSKKAEAKKMITVSGQQCFWINNGPVVSNLKELEMILKKLSNEQFDYHVNKDRNDFANWVEYVLMDTTCAKKLKSCKTKKAAHLCVSSAVKKYK